MNIVEEKKFIIIVGSPRSGTSWLQNILAAHPQVASLNVELKFFSSYIKPIFKSWDNEKYRVDRGHWRQGHPTIWSENEFNEFIADFANKTYAKVLRYNSMATHILDKHPGYSYAIDEIKRVIPDAKLIHIVRDARDVVPSMISAHRRIGFGKDNVSAAVKEWRNCVKHCLDASVKYPGDYLEIKYEDLRKSGATLLPDVFKFCQLEYNEQTIQKIISENSYDNKSVSSPDKNNEKIRASGKKVWVEKLSVYERYIIENEAGELLRKLGYVEDKSWWVQSKGDKTKIMLHKLKYELKRSLRRILK